MLSTPHDPPDWAQFRNSSPWAAYRDPDGVWRPPKREGLARVLAKAGYGARSRSQALVQAGRVSVDGRIVRDAGHAVTPQSEIRIDGEILREAARQYLAFHKPSRVDCQHLATNEYSIASYFPADLLGIEPAGRLAVRARGLILLSNDLWWNNRVCHNGQIERVFEALVKGRVCEIELAVMTAGAMLPGLGFFKTEEAVLLDRRDDGSLIRLSMKGGHDGQIRSAFKALRLEVLRLTRVALGPVNLNGLMCGRFRFLSGREISALADPRS